MTTGAVVLAAVVVAATAVGLLWQRRNGRVYPVASDTDRLSAADIGATLGERATLVQFTTAFCAPCRATRRILDDVARLVDGVVHVDVDAEANLDLVRRLDVRRTPTVLVLDAHGRVTRRASGQPRKADVLAALGSVL
jgi:thiol-disulfide isomerase/thioredoxin